MNIEYHKTLDRVLALEGIWNLRYTAIGAVPVFIFPVRTAGFMILRTFGCWMPGRRPSSRKGPDVYGGHD